MGRSVFLLLTFAAGTATFAADLHVAVDGLESNLGTAEAPFGSLARARDAVRAMKEAEGLPEGGVTVWVHAGAYELVETFALGEADSGTAQSPIVYRAADDGEVRLVGGRALPAGAFAGVSDEDVLARIDAVAHAAVQRADLKALGIGEYGDYPDAFGGGAAVSELFFDDERMTLARWPNGEWATIAGVVDGGVPEGVSYKADRPGTFEYAGDRPSRWTQAPGVWLHGYWCFDWRSETIKVARIDTDKRHIALAKIHHYGIGGGNPAPRRFYAVNLIEELDAPGEYYIDRDAGVLYFWPPRPLAEAQVVLSTLAAPLIEMDGVSHVTIQGLTLETCVCAAVQIKGGCENRVAACLVRNTGQDGIVIEGGEEHTVIACDIHDTGMAGLRLGGGDRPTLTACGHEALNNHIWRVSRRQRTAAYHVHLSGVGVRLAHNLLHDAPHQSIGIGGNDHIIEFNEIHHSGMASDDCGAFYMGRNPSERGTVIRHNYWHNIGSTFSHGSCAIYFDDGSGGQRVVGNVFLRAAGGNFGAVFSHGGHDNVVENNIFVDCKLALGSAPWNDRRWNEYVAADLWQNKLREEVDITKQPYSERYPGLKGFLEPTKARRENHARRNLVVDCETVKSGNWALTDNWVTEGDPGFVDGTSGNFALRDDSKVFQEIPGFKPIPFAQIGLYTSGLRPELPKQ